jgi:hypothetical protein
MSVSKFGTSENYLQSNYDAQLIGGISSKATKIQNGVVDNLVTVKNEDGEIQDSGISKSSIITLPISNDFNMNGKKITNIVNGGASDAVNKQYVDAQVTTIITDSAPVILQSTIARALTKSGSPQFLRSNIIHDIFRNNSKQNILICATTSYKASHLNFIIVPTITHYEIIDNNLWYDLYICNGDKSSWPRAERFDVIVQVLAFKPRPTTTFRSDDATQVAMNTVVNELGTGVSNVENTDASVQNNNEQSSSISQRRSKTNNLANSYI